jgi:drug/metabolite transporter (DMT)-like permease
MSIAHIMLWLTAIIWGTGFVAQSAGLNSLDPHSFNAARFILAAISLVPLLFIFPSKQSYPFRSLMLGGLVSGVFMFTGFSFQQTGLLYTTAGNAGFITSVYIVLVPILGMAFGQKTARNTWIGILFAIVGLYSLTIGPNLSINYGDALELAGSFFWASHVLIIGYLSKRLPAIPLAITQFSIAAVLAIIATLIWEAPKAADFYQAWLPIVYAGIAASSVACTLQILAQRSVAPSTSALILSTEAVFAVIAGWLFIGERLSVDAYVGCGLILIGMLISQWPNKEKPLSLEESKTVN